MPVPQPQNRDSGFALGNSNNPVVNAGGSLFFAGTSLQSNRLFDANYGLVSQANWGLRTGLSDNGPKIGKMTGTLKALSTGQFVTMTQGQYILMTFTSQVAGVANTVLRFSGSSYRKSNNLALAYANTRQIVKTGGWYYVNGKPVNATLSRDNVNKETSVGSYAAPGRLTFMSTGRPPTSQSYQARND